AARTGRRPVLVDRHPVLDAREAADGVLSRRTAIRIALSDINEVTLVVTPLGTAVGGKTLRYQRDDSGILASLDLLAVIITAIRDRREFLRAQRIASGFCHLLELLSIRAH